MGLSLWDVRIRVRCWRREAGTAPAGRLAMHRACHMVSLAASARILSGFNPGLISPRLLGNAPRHRWSCLSSECGRSSRPLPAAGFLTILSARRSNTRPCRGRARLIDHGGRRPRTPHDGQVAQLVEQRTENPRVGGSIPPLATTPNFLKRNGFPASPADYRRARGRKIDRPSDYRKSGRSGEFTTRCGRRPGELETWNSGIRAARRGVGRRRPAVARSARVGRARAAAMASPMARRRVSRVPRGRDFGACSPECPRTHVPLGIAVRL